MKNFTLSIIFILLIPFISLSQSDIVGGDLTDKQADDFIDKYKYKSVPHVMLLDNKGNLIDKWQFIPNLNQINQSISK